MVARMAVLVLGDAVEQRPVALELVHGELQAGLLAQASGKRLTGRSGVGAGGEWGETEPGARARIRAAAGATGVVVGRWFAGQAKSHTREPSEGRGFRGDRQGGGRLEGGRPACLVHGPRAAAFVGCGDRGEAYVAKVGGNGSFGEISTLLASYPGWWRPAAVASSR